VPRSIVLVPAGAFACTWEGGPTSLILSPSVSTAAGERTLPVFGSRSRPAFIRTFETGASAAACSAAKQRTVTRNKFRIATGAFRFGRNGFPPAKSFMTHRIIGSDQLSSRVARSAQLGLSKSITVIRSEAVPIFGSLQVRHHFFDVSR
jgi:hypothetical protein